jgi:hypothetical protein
MLQGRTLSPNERVDRHALRLRLEAGQRAQHLAAVVHALPHANDPTGADRDAGRAYILERTKPIVVGSRRDDRTIVLSARIQVVVVSVEAGLLQAARLGFGEHAQSHTRLEPQGLHAFDHRENAIERGSVFHFAPRGTHAKARGPELASAAGGSEHFVHVQHLFRVRRRFVVAGLRAIRAIFGTTSGFHAEERAELHFLLRVPRPMHRARLVEEGKKRPVVEGANGLVRWGRDGLGHATRTVAGVRSLELS